MNCPYGRIIHEDINLIAFVIPGPDPVSSTGQAPESSFSLDSRFRGNDEFCWDLFRWV